MKNAKQNAYVEAPIENSHLFILKTLSSSSISIPFTY